ncbi:MAG: hypothetical protein R6V56_01355 [Lentisphaeria bacterium]
MEKVLKSTCIAVIAAFISMAAVEAGETKIGKAAPHPAKQVVPGMANKAMRGGVNLVTGIVEWPMQTYKGWKNGVGFIENKPASKTVGTLLGFFLRGPGHAAGRTLSGGKNLFGFWTANRPDNEGIGIPLDAYYAWETGEQHSLFKPTFKEGIMPIPRKLGHGLVNGIAGIVELPGQIVQGQREGELGTGVVEGVWFWWSRSYNGFGDIFLCLVPNPEKTTGSPWDEKWPWDALFEEVPEN